MKGPHFRIYTILVDKTLACPTLMYCQIIWLTRVFCFFAFLAQVDRRVLHTGQHMLECVTVSYTETRLSYLILKYATNAIKLIHGQQQTDNSNQHGSQIYFFYMDCITLNPEVVSIKHNILSFHISRVALLKYSVVLPYIPQVVRRSSIPKKMCKEIESYPWHLHDLRILEILISKSFGQGNQNKCNFLIFFILATFSRIQDQNNSLIPLQDWVPFILYCMGWHY